MHILSVSLFLALFVGQAQSVTDAQACHFVGARFAKVRSTCIAGFCSSLQRAADGSFDDAGTGIVPEETRVPCDVAVVITRAVLSERGPPVRRSKRLRADDVGDGPEVAHLIHSRILPLFQLIGITGNVSTVEMQAALCEYDNVTLRLAARDWDRWTDHTVPFVLQSVPLTSAKTMFISTGWLWTRTSFARDEVAVGMMNFYFDFVSLLSTHIMDSHMVDMAHRGAMQRFPLHRPPHAFESRRADPVKAGVPVAIRRMLTVFDVLSASASPAMPKQSVVEVLMRFLSGFHPDDNRVTTALMSDQIRALCPSLPAFFRSLIQAGIPGDIRMKLGVSLIEFCRGSVGLEVLASTRTVFVESLKLNEGATAPAVGGAVDWLKLASSALPLAGSNATDRATIASRMVLELVASGTVSSNATPGMIRVEHADNARALGRAIGHGLLNGGDLRPLGISRELALFLHHRHRLHITSIEAFWRELPGIAPGHLNMFLPMVAGLDQTLSLVGADIFTDSEWLAGFGF